MNLVYIIAQIVIILCLLWAIIYNYKKEGKFEKYTYTGIILLILSIILLIVNLS